MRHAGDGDQSDCSQPMWPRFNRIRSVPVNYLKSRRDQRLVNPIFSSSSSSCSPWFSLRTFPLPTFCQESRVGFDEKGEGGGKKGGKETRAKAEEAR